MSKKYRKLIVGLGNPGDNYSKNRHNIGFIVVDNIAEECGLEWEFDKRSNSNIALGDSYILVKPQTYMNLSGEAVSKLMNFYDLGPEDLVIIHDDIDLEPGKVRMNKGARSAGHKGVQDIIEKLGSTDITRIRIGVGRSDNPKIGVEDWVLMDMNDEFIVKTIKSIDVSSFLE